MDRKSIIAIALSALVLAAWQYQNQKELQRWEQQHPKAAAISPAPAASPVVSGSTAALTPAPAALTPAAPEPQVPKQTQTVSTPAVDYTFTNLGGGISKLTLLKHDGAEPKTRMVLNAFGKHPLGAILQKPEESINEPYTVTVKDGRVVCERTLPSGLQITKTFVLPEKAKGAGEYIVQMEVTFANKGATPLSLAHYYVFAGSAEPIHKDDLPTYTCFGWSRDGKPTLIDVNWFNAGSMVGFKTREGHSQYEQAPGGVVWAGVTNQYFTSLLAASGTEGTPKTLALGVWANRIEDIKEENKEVKGIQGALQMPGFNLQPGESASQSFTLFSGPKEYRYLKAFGHGASDIMNFGWFKLISVALLRSMNLLNDWIGSYAWAIIILTFVVRGLLWPIQGAATRSMKKMQLLGPKMAELKEKYKDDPAKMNQEVMKLYKDYGVNPFSGCLPMLIQIPIFFGFYSMLGTAVELRNSHFLWVTDLSRPDTVGHFMGYPINILPIAMAATMVLQMQLTPKTGDPAQQKMMMIMPLIFVVFTYNFASALALYYTIQNILSIVQLYATRNEEMPKLEKVSVAAKRKK